MSCMGYSNVLFFRRQDPEISLIGLKQDILQAASTDDTEGKLLPVFSSCDGSLRSAACGPFLPL